MATRSAIASHARFSKSDARARISGAIVNEDDSDSEERQKKNEGRLKKGGKESTRSSSELSRRRGVFACVCLPHCRILQYVAGLREPIDILIINTRGVHSLSDGWLV